MCAQCSDVTPCRPYGAVSKTEASSVLSEPQSYCFGVYGTENSRSKILDVEIFRKNWTQIEI